jgi:hypothetical protein
LPEQILHESFYGNWPEKIVKKTVNF